MTYKRYLIIASKKDPAGINITTQLSQFRKNPIVGVISDKPNFDFYLREEEIISDENLDLEKINKYDFIIFASKHQSKLGVKSLSIHAPGNWKGNELGGKENKICPTSSQFQKQLFENLNKNAADLRDCQITLECTHHGPYIEKPCVFIEIGSNEEQWKDKKSGFVIAKTILDTIENFKENPYSENAFGIGGPHYCPNFNKIQLTSNFAISHIIPSYVLPLTDEMIKEAIKKTEEEIDFAILDWKGIPNSDERKRVIAILDDNKISWKKTGEIKR